MGNNRLLETRRDRKALARDAGLRRVSAVSALAGGLSGYGALAALLAIAGLLAIAINGGHDFGIRNEVRLKEGTALIIVLAGFLAFVFGGYTAGRMSRRSGAATGVVAGIVGAVLGVAVIALVIAAGGDTSLTGVATHLNLPNTWHDWRAVGLVSAIVSPVAMILGGLLGGRAGERWHAELLTRAADPTYGPEAERLAEAKKQAVDAEAAHLAAQEAARDRVARATAVSSLAGRPTVVEPAAASGERAVAIKADG